MEELIRGERTYNISFKKEKFKEILHFIIFQCGFKPNVGKTVLYKLLYFSDFNFYELFEEPLTGESYKKLEHGPAPIHFDQVIEELVKENKIFKLETKFKGFEQQKFVSTQEPQFKVITGKELQIIDKVIENYCHMTATKISAFSHEDLPYKATKDGDIINYELVFYRCPLFSVREYENDEI